MAVKPKSNGEVEPNGEVETIDDADVVINEGEDSEEGGSSTGLTVSYDTVEETGTTTMQITGAFTTEVRQVMVDGKVQFVSDAFGGHQPSLKKALDAAARNTIARSVAAAYEAANPKPEKGTRTRGPRNAGLSEEMIAQIARTAVEQFVAAQAQS